MAHQIQPPMALAMQIHAHGLQAVPLDFFYAAIIVHGAFFGMCFGVRNAIFMGMTHPLVAATQFTAYMALGNISISIGNLWQ